MEEMKILTPMSELCMNCEVEVIFDEFPNINMFTLHFLSNNNNRLLPSN